jgi:uncharacterized caspase-like protein
MLALLKELGYEIKNQDGLIGHVDGRLMQECIYRFFGDDDIKSDDTLLFYFSGHGIASKGDDFLASSNIEPKRSKINGFSFDDLAGEISPENCHAKKVVVILDSCLAGSLKIDSKGEDLSMVSSTRDHQSSKFKEGEGRCLLSSCMGFQESFATAEGSHSFFTNYLLKGLRGADGKSIDENGLVTPESLMRYIDHVIDYEIPKEKCPDQKPMRKIAFAGNVILADWSQKFPREFGSPADESLQKLLDEAAKRGALEAAKAKQEEIQKLPMCWS